MDAQYKVMLTLTTDERRMLNTVAAMLGRTPNRLVEAVLIERLAQWGDELGLPLPAREPLNGLPTMPGQLALPEAVSRPRRRRVTPKEESAPKRRTRK